MYMWICISLCVYIKGYRDFYADWRYDRCEYKACGFNLGWKAVVAFETLATVRTKLLLTGA